MVRVNSWKATRRCGAATYVTMSSLSTMHGRHIPHPQAESYGVTLINHCPSLLFLQQHQRWPPWAPCREKSPRSHSPLPHSPWNCQLASSVNDIGLLPALADSKLTAWLASWGPSSTGGLQMGPGGPAFSKQLLLKIRRWEYVLANLLPPASNADTAAVLTASPARFSVFSGFEVVSQ
jgi:hypothetical protein